MLFRDLAVVVAWTAAGLFGFRRFCSRKRSAGDTAGFHTL
jgi:hypothetical protein